MAEEITYIPYGLNEISQLDLMTNLANGLPSFMQQYKWLLKPKNQEKFLKAYDDITKNLTGATDSSGRWIINVNNIDMDSKSPKDREIYEHAAYYIQLLMSLMTPRVKEEEKKKEDLTPFNFTTDFNKYLLRGYGNSGEIFADPELGWDSLDVRGSNGLRGTEKRRAAMIKALQEYSDSLEDNKYNFEGTQFTDLADAKAKIQTAIDALKNTPNDESDDLPAFSALGLKYRSYFSNGGNDASGYQDSNGNSLTWNLYTEYQNKLAEAKLKATLEKLKAQKANQYDNYKYYNFLNGTPSNTQDFEGIVEKLSNQQALDGNDISRISWAFRQAEKVGGLVNLSKEELAKMPRYASTPGRLKKLQSGLDGIYYDTFSKRLVQPQKGSQLLGVTLLSILDLNNPEAIVKLEELLKLQASQRKLNNGWKTEDYLRMGAMALDIAGGIAAWTGPFGMATSGALGLTSLGTNMTADIADESMSKWDVAKNAGVNLGLAAVGMVPGLGLASKTGKWLTNIAKWAPRLLTILALKDTPEVYKSILKAVNKPSEVTNLDWKNIAYGLSIAAGLSRGAKGIVNNRKFKPTVTQETQTETYITTKSGKQIKATKELVEAINKAGRKGGNDKANEELRKLPGAQNEEVNINFKTGIKGKADLTNRVKLESSTKNIGQSPAVERYSRALSMKNIRDKAKHSLLSRYLPTDYDIYLSAAKVSAPNINIVDKFKQTWNPVSNRPFKGTKQNNNPQNPSNPSNSGTKTNTGSNAKPKQPILSKKDSDELLSTLRGKNFSTNEFRDESRVVGSIKGFGDLYGVRNSDGTHTLQIDFGGTRVNVTGTKADIKNKTLEVLRKDVMKKIDTQVPKERRSKIKFELIKQLKQNGYLKQGGQINPSLDTIIEDFINNNNI